jgi:hypothetical protein
MCKQYTGARGAPQLLPVKESKVLLPASIGAFLIQPRPRTVRLWLGADVNADEPEPMRCRLQRGTILTAPNGIRYVRPVIRSFACCNIVFHSSSFAAEENSVVAFVRRTDDDVVHAVQL